MGMAFLRMFKSKPREAKPQWGDFRIVRHETRGGEVQYLIERFGWVRRAHYRLYREWNTNQGHDQVRMTFVHPTEASALAEIARWRKAVADKEVIATTIVAVPAPSISRGRR